MRPPKALEDEWNKRLKDSGFDDIEDTNSAQRHLKRWDSFYFQARYEPAQFQHGREYFRRAGIFLESHRFQSHLDREIWRLHSEGETIRQIFARLSPEGKPCRATIHNIVKRLAAVMSSMNGEEEEQTDEQPKPSFRARRRAGR